MFINYHDIIINHIYVQDNHEKNMLSIAYSHTTLVN